MPIDTPPATNGAQPQGSALITLGTVFAVLFAIPSSFIGIYGVILMISGESLVGGVASAVWGYAAVVGAYELNRRRFDWVRGRNHRGLHLAAGMLAVLIAIVGSGALENMLFIFAVFPAAAAILHLRRESTGRPLALTYSVLLAGALAVAIWLYRNEFIARQLVANVEALP